MVNGISHRVSRVLRASIGGIAACVATLTLLSAAAPASAAPGRGDDDRGRSGLVGSVFVSGDWRDDDWDDDHDDHRSGGYADRDHGRGYGHGRAYDRPPVIVHGQSCSCGPCSIQREYARGFNRGESAGANQGFRDGFNGKRFCAEVRDDLCHESKAFVDGYMTSFSKAYRAAFEQGRFERARTCKPVYRPRCP